MLSSKAGGFTWGLSVLFGDFIGSHLPIQCKSDLTHNLRTNGYFLFQARSSSIYMNRKFQLYEADAHTLKSVNL